MAGTKKTPMEQKVISQLQAPESTLYLIFSYQYGGSSYSNSGADLNQFGKSSYSGASNTYGNNQGYSSVSQTQ